MKKWTRFERIFEVKYPDGSTRQVPDDERIYLNSRYQVHAVTLTDGTEWLSIKNLDRTARHDWRDFQRIKNELCGDEREGFEIYPAESRLHDSANQFHMWVLAEGVSLPYGFEHRYVCEAQPPGVGSQRKFETKPTDLLSEEEHDAMSPYVELRQPNPKENTVTTEKVLNE